MKSTSYTAWDGIKFSVHWYENVVAGPSLEYKTKVVERVNIIMCGRSISGWR